MIFFIKGIEPKKLIEQEIFIEQEILENNNRFDINVIENNFLIKDVFAFCDKENFSNLYCKNNLDNYLNNVITFCLKTNKIDKLNNVFQTIYKFNDKININNFFEIIKNLNEYNFSSLKKKNIKFFSIIIKILSNNVNQNLNDLNNYEILENFFLNFFTWSRDEKQNFFYFKEILNFFKIFKITYPGFTQINNTVMYLYKTMLNNPNIFTNDVLVKRFFYNFYYKYFLNQNIKNKFSITDINDYILKNKTINKNNNTFMFFYYREISIDENIKEIIKNIYLTFDHKKIPYLRNLSFYIYNNFFEYEIYTNYFNSYGHINKSNNTINVYMYLDQINNVTYIPLLIKKLYIFNYVNYDIENIPSWFIESLSKSLSDKKDFCIDNKSNNFILNINTSYNEYLLNVDYIDKKIFFLTKYNLKQLLSFLDKKEIDYNFLNTYEYKNIDFICLENKKPKHFFSLEKIIFQKNIILEYNNYYINVTENNINILSKNNYQLQYSKNYYLKEFRNSLENYLLTFSLKNQNDILNIYNNDFKPFYLYNYNFFIIFFTYIIKTNFNFYLKYINTDMKEQENFFLDFINKENKKQKECENNINKNLILSKSFSDYNFFYDLIFNENTNKKFKIDKKTLKQKINNNNTIKDVLIRFKYKYIDNEYVLKDTKDSNFICFTEYNIFNKINTQTSIANLNDKINILNEEYTKHQKQLLNVLQNNYVQHFNETILTEIIKDDLKLMNYDFKKNLSKNFNIIYSNLLNFENEQKYFLETLLKNFFNDLQNTFVNKFKEILDKQKNLFDLTDFFNNIKNTFINNFKEISLDNQKILIDLKENNKISYDNNKIVFDNNKLSYDNNKIIEKNKQLLEENNKILQENNILNKNNLETLNNETKIVLKHLETINNELKKVDVFFINITELINKNNKNKNEILENLNFHFINTNKFINNSNKNITHNNLFLFVINMFLIIMVCVVVYLFYIYN